MRPFRYTNIALAAALVILDIAYLAGIAQWWTLLFLLCIYVAVLIAGAIFIRWNFYLRSHSRAIKSPQIALTFDDGPASETEAILQILQQQQVVGAFFIIGSKAGQHAELISRIDAEGHAIGNHSFHHGFNFDWLPAAKMTEEIERTNELVHSITGKRPLLFRPPYGVTNPNLAKAVGHAGMQSVGWSLRSFDTKAKDPQKLLSRLLSRLEPGDIILLHDSMPVTRQILTEFIEAAKKKGFTFARVDELLDIEAYA